MRELHFTGQLTESDYRSINALASRKMWIICGVFLLFLLILNIWNGDLQQSLLNPWVTILAWLPLVLMIPVLFIGQRYFVRRHWKSNKVMQRPIKGTASDEGINWEVEGLSSSHVPWDLFLRYRESSNMLLVYQGINQVFYFFPRYFEDDTQWQEFRELVAQKLPRK
jgi:hypothetical protein